MKTQTMINFATVLYDQNIPKEDIEQTSNIINEVSQVTEILSNPLVSMDEKCKVIDRVFPEEICNYIKVVCKHNRFEIMSGILEAYNDLVKQNKKIITAKLFAFEKPSNKQLDGIKSFLCKEYNGTEALVEIIDSPELMGGFVLKVGSKEYDWSLKGRFDRMEQNMSRR